MYLSAKGVEFVAKDVMADEVAMAELAALSILTTPITVLDGEVVVGYDRKRIDQLLSA